MIRVAASLIVTVRMVATRFGMARVARVPGLGPSGFFALRMMGHYECSIGDIAENRCARGDVNVTTDLYRRDQLRITTDHAAITNLRDVLVIAVVIHRYD